MPCLRLCKLKKKIIIMKYRVNTINKPHQKTYQTFLLVEIFNSQAEIKRPVVFYLRFN